MIEITGLYPPNDWPIEAKAALLGFGLPVAEIQEENGQVIGYWVRGVEVLKTLFAHYWENVAIFLILRHPGLARQFLLFPTSICKEV